MFICLECKKLCCPWSPAAEFYSCILKKKLLLMLSAHYPKNLMYKIIHSSVEGGNLKTFQFL